MNRMQTEVDNRLNIIITKGVTLEYNQNEGNFIIKGPVNFEMVDNNTFIVKKSNGKVPVYAKTKDGEFKNEKM
ncbi:MAG: hypothetical protein IJH65_04315 [Methanobrevibacter sp.]|nr:hypothetical protein [Methanobrevibacter sp.]